MIVGNNITVQYGDRKVINNISFTLKEHAKLGLVGPNGAGKSTLIKILVGETNNFEGSVVIPKTTTIGYLKQEVFPKENKTILEVALEAFDDINVIKAELSVLEVKIGEAHDYESKEYQDTLDKYSLLTEQLAVMEEGTSEGKAVKILKGLGFIDEQLSKQVSTLSGGWLMRVEMAKLLLQQPDYLFLDEPTNHLDIESIIWLEQYLLEYPGSYLVISHDRAFLNNVSKGIIELRMGRVYNFTGNFEKHLVQRQEQIDIQTSAFENQQKEIEQKEKLIDKFRAKATKAKFAQSLIKQLDKIERLDEVELDHRRMRLQFPEPPRSGEVVINAININKRFGDNIVLDNLSLKILRGEKVSFIGQNGQGKSTMVKIITDNYKADSGDVGLGHNVKIAYYAQDQAEKLNPKISVLETMENEAFEHTTAQIRKILGAFLFSNEAVEKKVSVLSGGERSRLSLALLTLRPSNLLILDEPTNHLDMVSMEVIKKGIKDYKGTVIVVSHDRSFLSDLCEKTHYFTNKGIKTYLGDIDYFIEKSEIANIREAQISKQNKLEQKTKEVVKSQEPTLSFEERKKISKKIKYLERDIEKYEKELIENNIKMQDPEIFKSSEGEKLIKQSGIIKKSLEEAYEKWESITEKYGDLLT